MDEIPGKVVRGDDPRARKPAAGHGHARTRRAGCSDVVGVAGVSAPGARAEGNGNRADGVGLRRRAVTCRIFQMVLLRQVSPARVPIISITSTSSPGCVRPSRRSPCLHSSPRVRCRRLVRRGRHRRDSDPRISVLSWFHRRSQGLCAGSTKRLSAPEPVRGLPVVPVRRPSL